MQLEIESIRRGAVAAWVGWPTSEIIYRMHTPQPIPNVDDDEDDEDEDDRGGSGGNIDPDDDEGWSDDDEDEDDDTLWTAPTVAKR